jgi:hypothetical protein
VGKSPRSAPREQEEKTGWAVDEGQAHCPRRQARIVAGNARTGTKAVEASDRGPDMESEARREGQKEMNSVHTDMESEIYVFLCRKYVQQSSERQREMGLQYMTTETHDLAKEITRFVKSLPTT